jgi:hypothetical protein
MWSLEAGQAAAQRGAGRIQRPSPLARQGGVDLGWVQAVSSRVIPTTAKARSELRRGCLAATGDSSAQRLGVGEDSPRSGIGHPTTPTILDI